MKMVYITYIIMRMGSNLLLSSILDTVVLAWKNAVAFLHSNVCIKYVGQPVKKNIIGKFQLDISIFCYFACNLIHSLITVIWTEIFIGI